MEHGICAGFSRTCLFPCWGKMGWGAHVLNKQAIPMSSKSHETHTESTRQLKRPKLTSDGLENELDINDPDVELIIYEWHQLAPVRSSRGQD